MTVTYQTIDVLSSGGMAEVLVAVARQESGFAKPCIVKRVRPSMRDHATYASLLRVEAQIGAALSHANIVQVQGFATVDGHEAIIMELVEGVDLEHVLRTCARGALKLSTPMAILIAAEVARALAYVHSRGDLVTGQKLKLVHADVSPGNILISFEGEVKLTDFGIASSRLEGGAGDLLAFRGKKAYVPPEQDEGKDLDASADVFALGCVLFEMITGVKLLAEGDDRYAMLLRNLDGGLSDQHEDLRDIVGKMVALDPLKRYQSAAALERDLLRLLEEQHGGMARNRLGVFVQTTHTKEQKRCYRLLKEAMRAAPPRQQTPTTVLQAPAAPAPTPTQPAPAEGPIAHTPWVAKTPTGDVLHKGKDLSLAVSREDLEQARMAFIRNEEQSVFGVSSNTATPPSMTPRPAASRPAKSMTASRPARSAPAPVALSRRPSRDEVPGRGNRSGLIAALIVVAAAVGVALFFSARAKSSQAAHPAANPKGARHGTP